MELIELIRKQEAQTKIVLTDEERAFAVAFFEDRKKEKTALDAVNLKENCAKGVPDSHLDVGASALRDDVAAPDGDRSAFLSHAPDTDGTFVCVPRAL